MENKRRLTNKYILLAILLIAVFVLPSCRTRISNNSEITTVQYDESGFMSDEYQMRRDELGLSTAEKPLLPNFGSGESDDSDDFEEGEYIDYNPEDYQEDFTETETNTNNNNNNRNNSNTGTRNRSTTPSRGSSRGTTTTKYTVTFYGNGGEPKEQKKIFTKNNNKLAFPAQPTRSGYEFNGWWTKSKDGEGTQVKVGDEVKESKSLFAHWKEETPKPTPTPPKKEYYQVTLYEDGVTTVDKKIEKGKKYTLPSITRKSGYIASWNTKEDGSGKSYKPKDKVSSEITLYAVWDRKEANAYWSDMLADAIDKADNVDCHIIGSKEEKTLITGCAATYVGKEDSPEYVFLFVEDIDNPTEEDQAKIPEVLLEVPCILVGKGAISSENELVNKIAIMNLIHGSGLSEEDALKELEGSAILIK